MGKYFQYFTAAHFGAVPESALVLKPKNVGFCISCDIFRAKYFSKEFETK
jgi:hypothetical protein